MNMRTYSLPLLATVSLAATGFAQVTVDGSTAGDSYGAALSVQAVQTEFGDNASEWNAAYGVVDGGRLYLTLTGNLEGNFNKLEIFIDSKAGGENVLSGTPGNDGTGNMTGLILDTGFEADYHLIARRGFDGTTDKFDLDIAELGTPNFSGHFDIFAGVQEGSGTTGAGPGNASPIEVGYDNSNVAGIMGGTAAADMAAALAVTTGLELSIDLADLGSPSGDIKLLVFQNNNDHNYASNQFLGPLTAPQGNLGGDGFGGFTGVLNFDLSLTPGDQWFTVTQGGSLGSNYCMVTSNSTGGPALMNISGSLSIAAANFVMSASTVPNEPFVFFMGPVQIQQPFGDGFRCAGGTVVRVWPPGLASGNAAMRAVDLAPFGITPGTWNAQCWFRDPGGMGGSGFNLSDGAEVLITL